MYEKQCRLKESMKMMGLSNWIHWLAWFTKCFLFLLISVSLVTAILSVCISPAFVVVWSLFIFIAVITQKTLDVLMCIFILGSKYTGTL